MSETTNTATTATTTAAKKAAAAVSETLPTVVETVEVAMEMPSKVVLNQKLVVIVSVAAGVAIGAGGLWGFNKWRNRNKVVVAVEKPDSDEYTDNNV